MLLAGDIGGTKTELAIFSPEQGLWSPLARAEFPSMAHENLTAIVRVFLDQTGMRPERACFAVAGPVIHGHARITNLPWVLDEGELARDLGLASVRLINDLEALARAIVVLRPEDRRTLNAGEPVEGGAIGVIAPGTGLGEAYLTWDGSRYLAHASEGGHADFAPMDDLQIELLQYMWQHYEHVSYEHVCSGIGIPELYAFLRQRGAQPGSAALAARITQEQEPVRLVCAAALGHPPDALCAATIDLFLSILGAEAGNLALKVLATGGIYVGGGIPIHLAPLVENGRFIEAFARKGRFADILAQIPVYVLTRQVALIGAASAELT